MPPKKKSNPTVNPSLPVENSVYSTPAPKLKPVDTSNSERSPRHQQPAELMACLTRITLADLNELKRLSVSTSQSVDDQKRYDKIRNRVRLFLSSQRDQVYGQRLTQEVAPKLQDLTFMDRWAELIYQTANELLALKLENAAIHVPTVIAKMIGIVSASYRTATKEHQTGITREELDHLQQDMQVYLAKMAQQQDLVAQLSGLVVDEQALALFKAQAEQATFESQDKLIAISEPIADYQALQSAAENSLANKTPKQGEVLSTPTRQSLARVVLDIRAADAGNKTMLDLAIGLGDQALIEDVLIYAQHIDTAQITPAENTQTRLISLSLGEPLCPEQKNLFSPKASTLKRFPDTAMQAMIRYANDEALLLLLKRLRDDYPQEADLPEAVRQALQQRRDQNLNAAQGFKEATQCFAKTLQRYVTQYFKGNDDQRRGHYWAKLSEGLQTIQSIVLKDSSPQATTRIREALLQSSIMQKRLTTPGCLDRAIWTVDHLQGMRLTPKKIDPVSLTGSLCDQLQYSIEQKRGMESRYLLAQKVFAKVLKYLDKEDAWHIAKKQALLTVIDRFALGEIKTAQELMIRLTDKSSLLYAREDDKLTPSAEAKPSRSFGYVQKALKKYAHLLQKIQELPRPQCQGLVQGV